MENWYRLNNVPRSREYETRQNNKLSINKMNHKDLELP